MLLMLGAPTLAAQVPDAEEPDETLQATTGRTPVALVGDDAVYADEVAAVVLRTLGTRNVEAGSVPVLQARALSQLVNRRLAESYLIAQGYGPSGEEIDAEMERLKTALAERGATLSDLLEQQGLAAEAFRRRVAKRLAWKIGWPRYLDSRVTDDDLEHYYERHRREYDGTKVRASHILFRFDTGDGAPTLEDLSKRAADVRRRIASGELSFEEAARRYSDGPSRHEGGDLGFFPRHGVMDETFSTAAFQLEEGELSSPVLTPLGIHLIHCTDVEEGTQTFDEFREAMSPIDWQRFQAQVKQEIFLDVARREAALTRIQFTGTMPYFRPGTTTLVIPKQYLDNVRAASEPSSSESEPTPDGLLLPQ